MVTVTVLHLLIMVHIDSINTIEPQNFEKQPKAGVCYHLKHKNRTNKRNTSKGRK